MFQYRPYSLYCYNHRVFSRPFVWHRFCPTITPRHIVCLNCWGTLWSRPTAVDHKGRGSVFRNHLGRYSMPMQPQAGDQRPYTRRLPVGAEVCPQGGVHFRVWAPRCQHVEVILEGGPGQQTAAGPPVGVALCPETDGYFAGFLATAGPGTLYRYRLDGAEKLYPDPASRFQPDGPHGPSQVRAPKHFPGRMVTGRASGSLGKSSTKCTSAPSPTRGRGRPPAGSCRSYNPLASGCWK